MQKWLSFLLLVILFSGCSPAADEPGRILTPRPATPTPTAGASPTPIPEIQKGVRIALRVRGDTHSAPEVETGSMVVLEQIFEPEIHTITRRADGSISGTGMVAWVNAPVAQMRTCLAPDERGCTFGEWLPYQKSMNSELRVDWLGPRNLRLVAEFRDAKQAPIFALPGSVVLSVSGVVLPTTRLEKLPAPLLTAIAATRASAPLTGSVLIAEGRCCAGGTAGSTISLPVTFKAASPAAKVTEMRVQTGGGCQKNEPALNAPWEPFQEVKSYPARLTINWVGWWINVQYRDAAGNLSPVYCDDISLEGSPVRPTP